MNLATRLRLAYAGLRGNPEIILTIQQQERETAEIAAKAATARRALEDAARLAIIDANVANILHRRGDSSHAVDL